MSRYVTEIDVPDVQKRRVPSKHYVYIIHVTWSDNTKSTIYRRYSRFFDFQNNLLDKFPLEAGLLDPSKRVIPFLPGKIYFGRSHVRDVAIKRLQPIEEYCKALISLPSNISQNEEVLDFFEVEPDDLDPNAGQDEMKPKNKNIGKISAPKLAEEYVVIADYAKEDKWDLNLQAGMVVEVVEKSESGWWFVSMEEQQGWVPSTFLKRKDGQQEKIQKRLQPGREEKYICTEMYTAQAEDEVSLEKGTVVDVLEKTLDGWWRVRCNRKEGWAPATYLEKSETAHIHEGARMSGVQIVGTLSDISDLINTDQPVAAKPFKKKTRTLERGGSIRPPPRKNSIKNLQPDIEAGSVHSLTKQYVTIADFEDTVGDGISFKKGENVSVIEKTDGGWWYVKIGSSEGWIPSTYVKEGSSFPKEEEFTEDVYYADVPNSNSDDESRDSDDYIVPSSPKEQRRKPQPDPQSKKLPSLPSTKPSAISNAKDIASAIKFKLNNNNKEGDDSRPRVPVKVSNKPDSSPNSYGKDLLHPVPKVGERKLPSRPESPSVALKPASNPNHGRISPARPDGPFAIKKQESPQERPNTDLSHVLKNRFQKKEVESSEGTDVGSSDKFPGVTDRKLQPVLNRTSAAENKITSPAEESLADVLKAKFESRQSSGVGVLNEARNVEAKDRSTESTEGSKKALLPPGKLKPAVTSQRDASTPNVVKPDIPLKEPKTTIPTKFKSKVSDDSDLSSVLAAKFAARRNSDQSEICVKQSKPIAAAKPTLPSKALKPQVVNKNISPKTTRKVESETNVEHRESNVSTAALKSKFESAGLFSVEKKPVLPLKPKQESNSVKQTAPLVPSNSVQEDKGQICPKPLPPTKTKPVVANKPNTPSKKPNLPSKPVPGALVKNGKLKPEFITVADFYAENEGEISFESGITVKVLEKEDKGWWLISVDGQEGWAPSSYIEERQNT